MIRSARLNNIQASLAIACLIAATASAASGPSEVWRNWEYFRTIRTTNVPAPQLVEFFIPNDLYAKAQPNLNDLRIVDDQGREVAYVFPNIDSIPEPFQVSSKIIERSHSPGKYSQVVLDMEKNSGGPGASRTHCMATLDIAADNFFAWVEVAVSDDAKDWRLVKDQAPIFRFRTENREGTQTIKYTRTNAEYLRLRVLNSKSTITIGGVTVFDDILPDKQFLPVGFTLHEETLPQRTAWRVDLPAGSIPISQIQFTTPQDEFDRSVQVLTSEDGRQWQSAGGGDIYRFRQGGKVAEMLSVPVHPGLMNHIWRIEVVNGNDAALENIHADLMTTPRRVVFKQEPGRSYMLIYGQPLAREPRYDLELIVSKDAKGSSEAALGESQVNSNYVDPEPWTEKHSALLWIAMGIAAALLGYAAIGALRTSAREKMSE
jgi:hypothetical protein